MALAGWLFYGAGLTLAVAASIILIAEPSFLAGAAARERIIGGILLLLAGIVAMAGARAAAGRRAFAANEQG